MTEVRRVSAMENRWSARNISLLCAVPTDAFQAENIIRASTRSYVRVDADQSLDPPDLFNLVGFVKGGAEKVAALTMFGLSGLVALPYPYAAL
jgi:hypothetical protein